MKKIYFLLFISAIFASCSSGDDSTPADNGNNVSPGDYMPLTTGNYWVYDVQNTQQQGRDSLYITGDININGNSYKKFTTLNLPVGLFSNAIYNDGIRRSGDRLLLTGNFDFGFSEQFSISIPVNEFTILKENASLNQVLSSVSGSLTQPYNGYDVKFDYTLTSRAKEHLASYTVNQDTYNDVKKVATVLALKITAMVPVDGIGVFPVTIMQNQDVAVSHQYYAKNIGVVNVVTNISYQLSDFSQFGLQLPLPQSGSEQQQEVLDHYLAQ
ncbi:hypothetical protein CHU92_15385 [Flavobacterium cyanobacteriorum]|uniref:DUF3823 domain-containing protein n=1 Tax=Flavobacterium cyanobacteriorum TaxID=2022802 RepID=A0A255YTB0_9FLAO|nr:hypothetical protein [Flavobacterium cyanobacteriorum]OYQ31875.1 hypothetical protein CHU92_15385 [Flavobacterium cyanobacteriorum]